MPGTPTAVLTRVAATQAVPSSVSRRPPTDGWSMVSQAGEKGVALNINMECTFAFDIS